MRRSLVLALTVLLAACAHRPPAAPAAAPATSTLPSRLAWEVLGHGRLLLELPPGWTATTGDADPPLPASLRLEPPEGRPVLVLTPVWDPGLQPEAAASPDSARTLVELARRQAAESALEAPLELQALGGGATGWYFAATDRELGPGGRAPAPDEYRCILQGASVVGGLTLTFTLLDDGDGPHRAVALEVVRRARHLPLTAPAATDDGAAGPSGASPGEAPDRPDPSGWKGTGGAPVALAFPGKVWAVTIDLPGFLVDEPEARPDGRLISILGHHEASGLVASLVLSEAGVRRSAAACAEADWLRLAAFLPEVAGRGPPRGPAPRATYLVPSLRGRQVDQQNASAWWYRDGVCIHAHVSLMGFEPGDQPALDRVLSSVRFDEPL